MRGTQQTLALFSIVVRHFGFPHSTRNPARHGQMSWNSTTPLRCSAGRGGAVHISAGTGSYKRSSSGVTPPTSVEISNPVELREIRLNCGVELMLGGLVG